MSTKQNRNILFIIADDLGKYIAPYGCNATKTPNIDRFAEEGVTFDLAFASTASCSGSRSTVYTGLHVGVPQKETRMPLLSVTLADSMADAREWAVRTEPGRYPLSDI